MSQGEEMLPEPSQQIHFNQNLQRSNYNDLSL